MRVARGVRMLVVMRIALALFALCLLACGDNDYGTGRDRAVELADLAYQRAARCGFEMDPARVESMICDGRDCESELTANIDISECVADMRRWACDVQEWPTSCNRLFWKKWPTHVTP